MIDRLKLKLLLTRSHRPDVALLKPERLLLARIRGRQIRMLDLGVGSGRTAYTFAPLCTEYIGVESDGEQIEASRKLVGESPSVSFAEGGARDLSAWAGARFDVVLYSLNGLDTIEPEGRRKALGQIRSVIADDGIFCFSSHNLEAFPFSPSWPDALPHRPLRWAWRIGRHVPYNLRLQKINRDHDAGELRARGWAELVDGTRGFDAANYYVLPEIAERQLQAAGFRLEAAYDLNGGLIDLHAPPRDAFIHYFAIPI